MIADVRPTGSRRSGSTCAPASGDFVPFQLQVLELDGDRVRHVSAFFDPRLFADLRAARRGCPPTTEPAPRASRTRGDRRRSTGPSSCSTGRWATPASRWPTSPTTSSTGPTPCPAWSLGELLAHMEDALDAFTEAAAGAVDGAVHAAPPGIRVAGPAGKACALLGAWSRAVPGRRRGSAGDRPRSRAAGRHRRPRDHRPRLGRRPGHRARRPDPRRAGPRPARRGPARGRSRPTAGVRFAAAPRGRGGRAVRRPAAGVPGPDLTGPPEPISGDSARTARRGFLACAPCRHPRRSTARSPDVRPRASLPPALSRGRRARPRRAGHRGPRDLAARLRDRRRAGPRRLATARMLLATALDCRLARGDLGDALALGDELDAVPRPPGPRRRRSPTCARGELSAALSEHELAAGHFEAGRQLHGGAAPRSPTWCRGGSGPRSPRSGWASAPRRPRWPASTRRSPRPTGRRTPSRQALRTLATTDAGARPDRAAAPGPRAS